MQWDKSICSHQRTLQSASITSLRFFHFFFFNIFFGSKSLSRTICLSISVFESCFEASLLGKVTFILGNHLKKKFCGFLPKKSTMQKFHKAVHFCSKRIQLLCLCLKKKKRPKKKKDKKANIGLLVLGWLSDYEKSCLKCFYLLKSG